MLFFLHYYFFIFADPKMKRLNAVFFENIITVIYF